MLFKKKGTPPDYGFVFFFCMKEPYCEELIRLNRKVGFYNEKILCG